MIVYNAPTVSTLSAPSEQAVLTTRFEKFFRNFKVSKVTSSFLKDWPQPSLSIHIYFEVDAGTHIYQSYTCPLKAKKLPYILRPEKLVFISFNDENSALNSCFTYYNVPIEFLNYLETNTTYKHIVDAIETAFYQHITSEPFLTFTEGVQKELIKTNTTLLKERIKAAMSVGMSVDDIVSLVKEEYINAVMEE